MSITKKIFNNLIKRDTIYAYYYNKYYNLYMNNFLIGGIDYQQKDYLLRKLWSDGTIGCFKLPNSDTKEHPQGVLVFTPYSVNGFNIYDYPVQVIAVNTRGVKFIPAKPMLIDKEYVIGYAQRNKKNIHFVVDYYCRKIANIEIVIQVNLIAQKAPWLLATTPENKQKMDEIWNEILSDSPKLVASLEDADKTKAVVSGAPYIIDKLQAYKCELENELREFFGFDNLGVAEKKEHLITSEIESNDEAIALSANVFVDCLEEFIDRINEVFNMSLTLEVNKPKMDDYNETDEPTDEEVEDDEE